MSYRIGHFTHLSSLLSFLLFAQLTTLTAHDCMNAKRQWLQVRYDSNALLAGGNALPNFGRNIEVCTLEKTPPSTETPNPTASASCCDRMTEHEMLMIGHARVTQQISQRWLQVAIQMKNHSADLQDFFRSDLQQSKDRLNHFFSRIYGYNYKMHRNFFFGFFADLEGYMAGQKRQLGPIVDTFFNQLRDSIVSLIERSDQPTGSSAAAGMTSSQLGGSGGLDEAAEARRIRCLSDRVAQQQPFDGVDVLLRNRLLEAYPPARMLVNVLEVTSQLLIDLMHHVSNSPECPLAMTRAQFCSICAGRLPSETCPDTCKRLMSDCLRTEGGENVQLSTVWPRLVDSIVSITTRLERAFNFPAVNRYIQMQISEAITNVQSRYTESKSKYDAECRMATGGRGMPTPFSSSSSNTGQQRKPPSPPSASSWPSAPSQHNKWSPPSHSPSGYRYRPKRSAQLQQDFLDWQYRQPMLPVNPPAFANRPPGGHPTYPNNGVGSPATGYLPTMPSQQLPPSYGVGGFGAGGLADVNSATAPATADSQEGLIRWAAQMQHKYTSLSNLFADSDSGICPPVDALHQQPNATSEARCWSPNTPASSANLGLSSIVKQLSEAGEHLHQAASSTGDPEPLGKVRTSNMQYGGAAVGNQHMEGPFDWPSGAGPAAHGPLGNQQLPTDNQFQQWSPNHPAAAYNPTYDAAPVPPYEHVDTPLMGSSSGIEPSTLYGQGNFGYPPVGRQPLQPEAYGGQQQPLPPPQNNYQHLPMDPNAAYGPEIGLSSGQLPPQQPDTYYSPTPPGSNDPHLSSFNTDYWNRENNSPQWGVPPSQPPPTSHEWTTIQTAVPLPPHTVDQYANGSLPDEAAAAGDKAGPELLMGNESHVMNTSTVAIHTTTSAPKEVNFTTAPENTTRGDPAVPTHHSKQHPDNITPSPKSPLPDDEDSDTVHGPIPKRPSPTAPHLSPPSSWAENTPDTLTPWNEPSLGSGILPPSAPADLANYGWNTGQLNTGASQPNNFYTPPQHGTGFEVPGSFQPQPTHPYISPSKPVDPVPAWGAPDFSDVQPDQPLQGGWMPQPPESSGQFGNRWFSPDEHTVPDNHPQWPHNLPNSGAFDSSRTGTIDRAGENPQGRLADSQRPTTLPPQFAKQQPMLPHPPLPPPEVWVPAKISPGQSGPAILLVREYNIQGPYYGPETKNNHKNAAAGVHFRTQLTAFILIIPTTIFYLFV